MCSSPSRTDRDIAWPATVVAAVDTVALAMHGHSMSLTSTEVVVALDAPTMHSHAGYVMSPPAPPVDDALLLMSHVKKRSGMDCTQQQMNTVMSWPANTYIVDHN